MRRPETAVQPSRTIFHGSQSHFTTWRSASNSSIQVSWTLKGVRAWLQQHQAGGLENA